MNRLAVNAARRESRRNDAAFWAAMELFVGIPMLFIGIGAAAYVTVAGAAVVTRAVTPR